MYQHTLENRLTEINYYKKKRKKNEKTYKGEPGL